MFILHHPHGKVINYLEAKNNLHLNVELIDEKSPPAFQFFSLTNQAKLFENEQISIAMQVGTVKTQRQTQKSQE